MKRGLLIMAVLALTAGACSKKEPAAAPTPSAKAPVTLPGPVTLKGQTTIAGTKPEADLEVDDDYFSPTFIKVDPGATVSVKISNEGQHTHTFTIDALGIDQLLSPGASKTLTFTMPSGAGANFYCKFHSPSGMQGAFYFAAGATFPARGTSTSTPKASSKATSGGSGYGY